MNTLGDLATWRQEQADRAADRVQRGEVHYYPAAVQIYLNRAADAARLRRAWLRCASAVARKTDPMTADVLLAASYDVKGTLVPFRAYTW
jgi:hypothetical protein